MIEGKGVYPDSLLTQGEGFESPQYHGGRSWETMSRLPAWELSTAKRTRSGERLAQGLAVAQWSRAPHFLGKVAQLVRASL